MKGLTNLVNRARLEVEVHDIVLVTVARHPQAELTLKGLPPHPSSQVGVGPAADCVYVGQNV